MSVIDIPRTTSDLQQGGCWWATVENNPLTYVIVMRCPECNQISDLDDHNIDSDGVVTPSLICPREHCDFHEMVRLLDWP
jgi:hypothetical protein